MFLRIVIFLQFEKCQLFYKKSVGWFPLSVCMYIIYGLVQSKLRNKLGNRKTAKTCISVQITTSVWATKIQLQNHFWKDKCSRRDCITSHWSGMVLLTEASVWRETFLPCDTKIAQCMLWCFVCLFIGLSQVGVLPKLLNVGSRK